MNLIGNLVSFPSGGGGIFPRALKPEEPPHMRTHEVQVSIVIYVVQDAVNALGLPLRALYLKRGQNLLCLIFRTMKH